MMSVTSRLTGVCDMANKIKMTEEEEDGKKKQQCDKNNTATFSFCVC